MNTYREVLYSGYSANFGELKAFDQGRSQFLLYDAVYSDFAPALDAVILDVGSGKGEWLGWLKNKGFKNLVGVDGAASDVATAKEWLPGVTFHQGNLLDYLDGVMGGYDVIHAKDVIEHLTKDEIVRLLTSAKTALKSGGQIWIQTFNAQAPLAAATRYGDFTHETGLTPQSMAQCLAACGFKKVRVRGVHYCSSSVSGRLRRLLSLPVHWVSRLILRLRHGGAGSQHAEVDRFCVLPDMVAVGEVD